MKDFLKFFFVPLVVFVVLGSAYLASQFSLPLWSTILFGCGNFVCEEDESEESCPSDCWSANSCWNGICDGTESPESCSTDCVLSDSCGNGVCEESETPESCSADCPLNTSTCGNGMCEGNETSETCSIDCYSTLTCGNSALDAWEQCDGVDAVCFSYGANSVCQPDCTCSVSTSWSCWDGSLQPENGEECDEGSNNANTGHCLNSCKINVCGDSYHYAFDEECDDGNTKDGDGCSGTCKDENLCGNNKKDAGEACDEGWANSWTWNCLPDCRKQYCGNGKKWPEEECDDGNVEKGDGCGETCKIEPVCGNAKKEAWEACDLGFLNGMFFSLCTIECKWNVCGDSFQNFLEACDDGNQINEDGCSAACKIEKCWDGIKQEKMNEECDDGNDKPGDGCDKCKIGGGPCSDANKQKWCVCDDAYTQRKVDEAVNLMIQEKPDTVQINKKISELPMDCIKPYICKQSPEQYTCTLPTKGTKTMALLQLYLLVWNKDFKGNYVVDSKGNTLKDKKGDLINVFDGKYRSSREILLASEVKSETRDELIQQFWTYKKLDTVESECGFITTLIRDNLILDYEPSWKKLKVAKMALYLNEAYSGSLDGGYAPAVAKGIKNYYKYTDNIWWEQYLPDWSEDWYLGHATTYGSNDSDDSGEGSSLYVPDGHMNTEDVKYRESKKFKGLWVVDTKNSQVVSLPLNIVAPQVCPELGSTPIVLLKEKIAKAIKEYEWAKSAISGQISVLEKKKPQPTGEINALKAQRAELEKTLGKIKSINLDTHCAPLVKTNPWWKREFGSMAQCITTLYNGATILPEIFGESSDSCKYRLIRATVTVTSRDNGQSDGGEVSSQFRLGDIGPSQFIWSRSENKTPVIDVSVLSWHKLWLTDVTSNKTTNYDICFKIN